MTDNPIRPFSSIHVISKWVLIFCILSVAFTIIYSVSLLMEIELLSSLIDGAQIPDETLDANDTRVFVISISSAAISFTLMVLFFIWFYKAYRNLPSLGGQELGLSPRRAIIYFFIPILWFYKPYGATKEIWHVSDPNTKTVDRALRRQMSTPSLIKAWWALWIVTNLIGNLYLRAIPYMMSADTLPEIMSLDVMDLVTNIPMVISDVLTFFLVKKISLRQEQKSISQN